MSEALDELGVADAQPSADVQAAEPIDATDVAPVDTPAAPEAPEVDWNDIAFWNEVSQRAQQMGLTLTVPDAPAPQAEPEVPQFIDEYGNFDQRAFQEFLGQRDERLIAQLTERSAPIERFVQEQEAERVNGLIAADVRSVMTAAGVDEAELPLVRILAQQFASDPEVARHGATSAGVRAATQKGLDWLAARDRTNADKAVEAFKQSLTEGGSHLLDPSVRGAGVAAGREFSDELDVARNYRFA